MKTITIIKKSKISGLGVFANRDIMPGENIEKCRVILLPQKDIKYIDKTNLYNYYFSWKFCNQIAIALGNGSIYNHSYKPNAKYQKDIKNNIIMFEAVKIIKKGEEIFVNYNGKPTSQKKVWFDK